MAKTKSGEALEEAKKYINLSIFCLSRLVIDKIEGTENYCKEYEITLKESLFELINIREKIF
jgi:hypothetical protein